MKFRNEQRGFTLIELLVVIAIIGLLSSVILASLNGARKKGRDARRLSDLKSIQTALELYYSDNNAYPAATTQTTAATALSSLVTGGQMQTVPDDPLGGTYHYVYKTTTGGGFYCLGSIIEGTAPSSTCNTGSTGLNSALTGVQYSVGP